MSFLIQDFSMDGFASLCDLCDFAVNIILAKRGSI